MGDKVDGKVDPQSIGRSAGKGLREAREFRDALTGKETPKPAATPTTPAPAPAPPRRKMKPRTLRALLLALALALLAATPAAAKITALDGDSGAFVTEWSTLKCKLKSGDFLATAKSSEGYFLDINISGFGGFGNQYDLIYGQKDPNFFVSGNGQLFSNQFSPPDVEGQPGGFIVFSANGKRIGFGFSPASNEDQSTGLSLGGGAKCKYPKRRHH